MSELHIENAQYSLQPNFFYHIVWEPTDNTSTENLVLSLMMIDDLINEVSLKYPEAKAVFSLLMDDPQISNALKQVDLKKGKSQAYEYVKKMQAYAKELYNKNYR